MTWFDRVLNNLILIAQWEIDKKVQQRNRETSKMARVILSRNQDSGDESFKTPISGCILKVKFIEPAVKCERKR